MASAGCRCDARQSASRACRRRCRSRSRSISAMRSALPSCGVVVRANSSARIRRRGEPRVKNRLQLQNLARKRGEQAADLRFASHPEPRDLIEEAPCVRAAAGTGRPKAAQSATNPHVCSETLLPPIFGPVSTATSCNSRSSGTNCRPAAISSASSGRKRRALECAARLSLAIVAGVQPYRRAKRAAASSTSSSPSAALRCAERCGVLAHERREPCAHALFGIRDRSRPPRRAARARQATPRRIRARRADRLALRAAPESPAGSVPGISARITMNSSPSMPSRPSARAARSLSRPRAASSSACSRPRRSRADSSCGSNASAR